MVWEADVATADGGTVHVRPIEPDDGERLLDFHGRQSQESIYYRYFSARPRLSAAEVRHFTTVDHVDREAFVALVDDVLVGIGRYDRFRDADEAEVAFFIDDANHGRGLATILLEYLAARARENGICRFVAHVLPGNRGMLTVFKQAGFGATSRFNDGVVEVEFAVDETEESVAAAEARASRAEVRAVARLLEPRAVAVIGAGRRSGTIGHEVLRQLLAHEFAGPVYPVNPEALHVASVPAWPSVLDLPGPIDLAVVAVPAEEVPAALDDCARARVGAVVVVSTGFLDAGEEGRARLDALVVEARRHGVRLLGPASMGVVNTAPGVRLHATFAPIDPQPGRVALSLQSGTLGAAIVDRATALGLGFSSIVAVGDKGDVSGNDLLAWWEADARTDVVVLSLESFGNPRRFRHLAPRVGRVKPIVAHLRHGPTDARLLLSQTGIIGVDTMEEALDVASVLAWQPVPAGRRVRVVTDNPGAAEFASAVAESAGLAVTATSLGLGAGPAEFEAATLAALGDADVDAVLAVYTAPLDARPADVARALAAAASSQATKPVVASFPGHDLPARIAIESDRALPNIDFPDRAARALARVAAHGDWRARPVGTVAAVDGVDLDGARAAVAAHLAGAGPGPLADPAALARAAGIDVVAQRTVATVDDAVAAAEAIGWPVALKAAGRARGAKTEAAGVALDVHDGTELRASWARMVEAVGPAMDHAVVQAMCGPGVDVRVVLEPAPIVGATIGLGPGGALAGLLAPLAPVARAVLPLTDLAAAGLVEDAGLAAVLPAAARAALADLLGRLAVLADEVPELVAAELNPVIVNATGAHLTDLTVVVEPDVPGLPDTLRRL